MKDIKVIDNTSKDKILTEGGIDIDEEELKEKKDYFLYNSPDCFIIYPDGNYACGINLTKDRSPRPFETLIHGYTECNKCGELKAKARALKGREEKLNQEIQLKDYFCAISTVSTLKANKELDILYCNQEGQNQNISVCIRKNCLHLREKLLVYKIDELIKLSKIVKSL